ncbi:hypothetical protein C2845_PM11G04600 [Panicum miliaceum]|uniref:Uncharacterized protein n=1 Tax=Panicum miliaceum TaxID=4540 RepID=A0A3L6RQQ6_PANMI|nr:hypothetical protein C2845_PM11G04600 [Panicum miliaceum]
MMQTWADQEEQERDRFSKPDSDYSNKRSNIDRNDRSQRDYSGSSQKRKTDNLIAAVDCTPRVREAPAEKMPVASTLQALGFRVLSAPKVSRCSALG